MSAHSTAAHASAQTHEHTLWDRLPWMAAALGLLGCVAGYIIEGQKNFAHAYLVAFMFFLSIALGSFFLVLIHHLFDAYWSVPIRRFLEHLASLLPWMALFFLPIGLMSGDLYYWMSVDPAKDHALAVKQVLFNKKTWGIASAVLFGVWWLWTHKLRSWSLRQDETGAAECTVAMRRWAASGIFVFAFSLTAAAIFWMKSLEHQWFSTMYGVYYFAGSVWVALATAYAIALLLKRSNMVPMMGEEQFHSLAKLLFAFTVFYAYIHFSQYFLIWNAALPEETFWYAKREQGNWAYVGWVIILGHFLLPFLTLLRIDAKLNLKVAIPIFVWVWLMHHVDMQFNIMPLVQPDGPVFLISSLSAMLLIGGLLTALFLWELRRHPAFPLKDPRMGEAVRH